MVVICVVSCLNEWDMDSLSLPLERYTDIAVCVLRDDAHVTSAAVAPEAAPKLVRVSVRVLRRLRSPSLLHSNERQSPVENTIIKPVSESTDLGHI